MIVSVTGRGFHPSKPANNFLRAPRFSVSRLKPNLPMNIDSLPLPPSLDRRRFLARLAFAAALFTAPGAFAEALTLTPRQTEGPFYPDHLPLDTDNDLLILNDAITPAVGEVTYV